jgi:hypothetical protein
MGGALRFSVNLQSAAFFVPLEPERTMPMENSTLVTPKRYAGRRDDCAVLNMTMDAEALELLRQFCPEGRRVTGRFMARLIYEHAARQNERRRLGLGEDAGAAVTTGAVDEENEES